MMYTDEQLEKMIDVNGERLNLLHELLRARGVVKAARDLVMRSCAKWAKKGNCTCSECVFFEKLAVYDRSVKILTSSPESLEAAIVGLP